MKYYPTVDTKAYNEVIKTKLERHADLIDPKMIEPILEACKLCSENSLIKFDQNTYKQIRKVPAGLSHVPAYTDIGSSNLMDTIISQAPFKIMKNKNGKACTGLFCDDGLALVYGLTEDDVNCKTIAQFKAVMQKQI